MISIVYSTRTPNKQFQEHIKKSIGVKVIGKKGKYVLFKPMPSSLVISLRVQHPREVFKITSDVLPPSHVFWKCWS